jgi:hypothetical protein
VLGEEGPRFEQRSGRRGTALIGHVSERIVGEPEIGLDIGIADARLRRPRQNVETDLRRSLRRLVTSRGTIGRRSS